MNKTEALRILIAAQDDPILASWAAVAHEHRTSGVGDVSPYEYWEAFQRLFDYGLISPDQFNGVDPHQEFFSGRRVSTGAIQRVLSNLKLLPERHEQELPMSKHSLGNPFADDNALVTRDSGGTALNGRNGHGPALPARQAHELGMANPFSPANETLPREKRSLELEPFAQQAGLPCRDPSGADRLPVRGPRSLRVVCGDAGGPPDCNQEVIMDVDDMLGGEGPNDNIPGGQVQILARVLCGTCRRCGTKHHHSAGTIDINDVG